MAMDIEYIEWEDHWGLVGKGWYNKDDVPEMVPHVIQQVGFIYHEDDKAIYVVSQINTTGHVYGDGTYILKANITKRTKL